MISRTLPLAVCLLFLGSCGGLARVHAGYLQLSPTGDLALEGSPATGNPGTRVDINDEFGIEDRGAPFLRGEVDLGDLTLLGSGYVFSQAGNSQLSQPFGDLPAGSNVNSDLDILNVKAALTYDFDVLPTLDLGIGLAINYFDVDFKVAASSPVVGFEDIDFKAPVPMLYGRSRLDLGIVDLMLELGWINLDIGDGKGNFLDAEAMVTVNILPWIEVMAGYRYSLIDVEGDVDAQKFGTDLELQGWILGGGINF